MQMFDAYPKFPHAGMIEGNMMNCHGASDECFKVDQGAVHGKYCLM